jgi:hypothetical protein
VSVLLAATLVLNVIPALIATSKTEVDAGGATSSRYILQWVHKQGTTWLDPCQFCPQEFVTMAPLITTKNCPNSTDDKSYKEPGYHHRRLPLSLYFEHMDVCPPQFKSSMPTADGVASAVIYFGVPMTPDTHEALIRCHVKGDVSYLLAVQQEQPTTFGVARILGQQMAKPYNKISATSAQLS